MDALNDRTANLCPGFKFVATPTRGDKTSGTAKSVDCGLYPAKYAPRPGVNDAGEPTSPAVDWSRIQLSIEVKSKSRKDPFVDTNVNGKSDSAERLEVLGQILDYMKHVFDHQHRTCQYMVIIVEENARLLRIDRSGIFATKAFNFKTNGTPLIDFLWRFARLSPEERGEDATAERVPHDSKIVRDIRRRARNAPNDYIWKLFMESLEDEAYPWWILTVDDECTKTTRRFFVGKPNFKAQGVAGRGTRGYVALELDKGDTPFVYTKDCWRVVHDEIKKEGVVLQTLNAENVPHIPTVACHGDMGQTTKSQDLWHKYHPEVSPDAPCPLKKHEHYRLVVKEVGKPLIKFETGIQLLFALFCCLKAHKAAYQLGIIHRDISVGNILLIQRPDGLWRGMLNDWELSKEVDSESPVGRQPDRTGTWQFLSAHALNDSEKLIVIQDELESVFHALVYMSIRFLPHNCATASVGRLLYDYFDDFQDTDKGYGCGKTKLVAMRTGQIFFVQG
ncbi:uncharacterized protein TRAVEDRAFT_132862, partial [Trametes versicolor FP-101664 SS1]|uniref:uncharacterized protein n=1 Tax=Trametes versicolor (strain FP-101664) TaxID=717944 RepID=UPI0004623338